MVTLNSNYTIVFAGVQLGFLSSFGGKQGAFRAEFQKTEKFLRFGTVGNKKERNTIFCDQIGYKADKLSISSDFPLDNHKREHYHKPRKKTEGGDRGWFWQDCRSCPFSISQVLWPVRSSPPDATCGAPGATTRDWFFRN